MLGSRRSALATVALLAACAAAPPHDRQADERAVRALWRAFECAFNAGDAVAMAQLYDEGADRISSSGELVRGRATIEQRYAEMLDRRAAAGVRTPFHADVEVRVVASDAAVLDGTWSGTRAGQPVRGFFTMVVTRRDGVWRISAGRDRGYVPRSP